MKIFENVRFEDETVLRNASATSIPRRASATLKLVSVFVSQDGKGQSKDFTIA